MKKLEENMRRFNTKNLNEQTVRLNSEEALKKLDEIDRQIGILHTKMNSVIKSVTRLVGAEFDKGPK